MSSIRTTLLLTILLWIVWFSCAAAENLATFNINIPVGKWKAAKLKNLPKDAVVAVQVVSNGEITVALVDLRDYQRFSETSRPLFAGRVEKRLAFSVSIPVKGDYFLVLDNRSGLESRAVTVTVRAARSGTGQTKAAGDILKNFERQLHRIFVFTPFPWGSKSVDRPGPSLAHRGSSCAKNTCIIFSIFSRTKKKPKTSSPLLYSMR